MNVDALIVTGSSDCTIRASVVIEADLKIIRVKSELLGFGNNKNIVKSHGIVRECLLIDNCVAENVVFRIMMLLWDKISLTCQMLVT